MLGGWNLMLTLQPCCLKTRKTGINKRAFRSQGLLTRLIQYNFSKHSITSNYYFTPKSPRCQAAEKELHFLQNNSFKDLLNFHQEKTFPAKEVELRFCQKIYMNVPFS